MRVIQATLEWGGKLTPLKPEEVKYIIVHHAAVKEASPEAIHRNHIGRGWAGIGYNEYIRKDGTVYICRGDHVGAHTKGWNDKSYGICVEGNYEEETEMPEAQFKALVQRIVANKARFPNLEGIKGHRDFVATVCPGKNFPMDRLMEELKKWENQKAPIKIYRVQAGAFRNRENAEKLVKQLKELGFDAFIREEEG
jgi:hypothetical protein